MPRGERLCFRALDLGHTPRSPVGNARKAAMLALHLGALRQSLLELRARALKARAQLDLRLLELRDHAGLQLRCAVRLVKLLYAQLLGGLKTLARLGLGGVPALHELELRVRIAQRRAQFGRFRCLVRRGAQRVPQLRLERALRVLKVEALLAVLRGALARFGELTLDERERLLQRGARAPLRLESLSHHLNLALELGA